MTTATPNFPLIREVAEWITQQTSIAKDSYDRYRVVQMANRPDAETLMWDQNSWFDYVYARSSTPETPEPCGTACCMAGYVALTSPEVDGSKTLDLRTGVVILKDGTQAHVVDFARTKLGLTPEQAEDLFFMSDTRPEAVLDYLSEIAGEDVRPVS